MEHPNKVNLIPISCSQLATQLSSNGRLLLVDTRPNAQHCSKHIKHSENVNFSNILLRRLLKGVVQLSTLVPSTELAERLTSRDSELERLVVYDACSKYDSIRTELLKHAEILAKTELRKESDWTVYFLDGGLEAMCAEYAHLCTTSSASGKKARSPLGISVSASLPIISLHGQSKRQFSKLQTPSEDSSSQFGPPVEILPHLMLGCAKDSSNLTQLRKQGVTAVLNVSHNCPNHFESLLEYRSIHVQDSYQADLLSKMDAAIDYINSIKAKNGCVFVHCHAGISRSATICIAYIMKTMQWDLSRAYEFVKQKRPRISPNLHFMGQLLEFQKQLQELWGENMSHVDDMADTCADTPQPILSHAAAYCDVSIYDCTSPVMEELEDECDSFHCSSLTPLPSASAPSSLNFGNNDSKSKQDQFDPNHSAQVSTKDSRNHRSVTKPTTLPLLKSISLQPTTYYTTHTDSLLWKDRQLLSSISLPATPITQYKNHLPYASSPQRVPHPLQLSPCRVEAALGSRSESCLNYYHHSPLAESM